MTYPLRSVQLFESFSDTECADLVRFMRERKFAAGETVCRHGEHGNTMLLVTQGALSAVVPGKGEKPHEIARLGEGAVFGEMFCLDPAPRPVTLVASEPTTILELAREDLITMRQRAPRVAASLVSAVFRDVLKRLRSVDDRIDRELRSDAAPTSPPILAPMAPSKSPNLSGRHSPRLRGSA